MNKPPLSSLDVDSDKRATSIDDFITERLEARILRGDIGVDQYILEREKLIGYPTVYDHVLKPLVRRFFSSRT